MSLFRKKDRRRVPVADIEMSLKEAMAIEGALGAALVDYNSGMMLGAAGGTEIDLAVA